MNKKIIKPMLTLSALSAVSVAPLATLVGCANVQEQTITEKWIDIQTFKPQYKFQTFKDEEEGIKFTKSGLINTYASIILGYPEIFTQDLIYSIQKTIVWRMKDLGAKNKYYIRDFRKYRIKISDLKLKDCRKDTVLPGVRFSCKIDYEIDFDYYDLFEEKIETINLTGDMTFKDFPLWLPPVATEELKTFGVVANDEGITHVCFYSYCLGEEAMLNDNTWSITMNERGVYTSDKSGKLKISDTWNSKMLKAANWIPGKTYFGTNLMEFITNYAELHKNQATGDTYGKSYFILISYYMEDVRTTYSVSESGEPYPEMEPDPEQEEEEGEGGEAGQEGKAEEPARNCRVLI